MSSRTNTKLQKFCYVDLVTHIHNQLFPFKLNIFVHALKRIAKSKLGHACSLLTYTRSRTKKSRSIFLLNLCISGQKPITIIMIHANAFSLKVRAIKCKIIRIIFIQMVIVCRSAMQTPRHARVQENGKK